ncbi:unnamed protein product [Acanthosepion pharaonis]|uniref:Uncharacterized protein n=1 Tax=Acanthosepion pharaonis TaxID=158019 RepID=A0A812CQZ5_ACAPH|nr:unnamed protein product [Sepia pharaonis]
MEFCSYLYLSIYLFFIYLSISLFISMSVHIYLSTSYYHFSIYLSIFLRLAYYNKRSTITAVKFRPRSVFFCPENWLNMPFLKEPRLLPNTPAPRSIGILYKYINFPLPFLLSLIVSLNSFFLSLSLSIYLSLHFPTLFRLFACTSPHVTFS